MLSYPPVRLSRRYFHRPFPETRYIYLLALLTERTKKLTFLLAQQVEKEDQPAPHEERRTGRYIYIDYIYILVDTMTHVLHRNFLGALFFFSGTPCTRIDLYTL